MIRANTATAALGMITLFALLVALGFWQLDRAGQKRARTAEYAERIEAVAIDAADVTGIALDTIRWRKVNARGTFADTSILLDNRTVAGRIGYEVLTPFVIREGLAVLVNRGFIAAPPDRSAAPTIPTPLAALAIFGFAGPPPVTGVSFSAAADTMEQMSAELVRVQHVNLATIEQHLQIDLEDYVIYLDSDAPAGFAREWLPPGDGSAKHEAYAAQWFAMAAIVVVIGISLWRRRARRTGV